VSTATAKKLLCSSLNSITSSLCVCRVSNSLVSAYEAVYELLDDPTAGYAEQGGSAVVKHTPTQVRTILGVL
jgi:hypothetical protein